MRRIPLVLAISLLAAAAPRAQAAGAKPTSDARRLAVTRAPARLAIVKSRDLRSAIRRTAALQRSDANANHMYNVDRDLRSYVYYFGNIRFVSTLRNLKPSQTWLDVGAGRGLALRDFATSEALHVYDGRQGNSIELSLGRTTRRPKMIGLALAKPEWTDSNLEPFVQKGRMQYVEDSVESFSIQNPASVDLITDVHAAAQYSRLDEVLHSYGLLLRPGGRAFLRMSSATIFDPSGQELTPIEYLRSIKGFKVYAAPRSALRGQYDHTYSMMLVRTSEPIEVPKLRLKSREMSSDGPQSVYETVAHRE